MQELKANMAVLGKEAAAALAAVESQQERLTFQRLVAMVCMLVHLCFSWGWNLSFALSTIFILRKSEYNHLQVEAEKLYHERVAVILGNIEAEVCGFPFLVLWRHTLHLGIFSWQFAISTDSFWKTAKRGCSSCSHTSCKPSSPNTWENKILFGRGNPCFNNSNPSCYNLIAEWFIYYTIWKKHLREMKHGRKLRGSEDALICTVLLFY